MVIDETRRWGQRLIAADDDEDTAEIIIEGDFLTEYPDKVENNDQLITVPSRETEFQPDKSEREPRGTNNQDDLKGEKELISFPFTVN